MPDSRSTDDRLLPREWSVLTLYLMLGSLMLLFVASLGVWSVISLQGKGVSLATGRVVEDGSKRPIQGAVVQVRSHAIPVALGDPRYLVDQILKRERMAMSVIETTDAAGTFAIAYDDLGGEANLSVTAEGFATNVPIASDPKTWIEVRMQRSSSSIVDSSRSH